MPLRTSSAATNTIGKPCVLSSPLDADERRSLKRCERVIARGAKAFIAVGLALSEIKERRLYREEFPTFEAYCQARLNCSRSLGYRLITHAAMVIEMGVSPIGDKLGTESQARELARVPREMRKEVLRLADEMAEGGPLTARLIRQAAIELGVNGNPLLPNGGNDDVQTPAELAKAIVAHFLPSGRVLEPCRGGGAFVKAIPGCDWCDLAAGRDFLAAKGHWDWIVSNPPYSQFRAFLQKAMQVADNIVFISLVGAWFVQNRQEEMRMAGFALVELAELPIPPDWPQFGLELSAGWVRRGWQGSIAHTRLDGVPGRNGQG